jgi:hypothetical protein
VRREKGCIPVKRPPQSLVVEDIVPWLFAVRGDELLTYLILRGWEKMLLAKVF